MIGGIFFFILHILGDSKHYLNFKGLFPKGNVLKLLILWGFYHSILGKRYVVQANLSLWRVIGSVSGWFYVISSLSIVMGGVISRPYVVSSLGLFKDWTELLVFRLEYCLILQYQKEYCRKTESANATGVLEEVMRMAGDNTPVSLTCIWWEV